MPYGYNGKILHIDLTNGKTKVEEPDEVFYRTYMGGGCLGAYYLLKETDPGVDPLSPDNVLILAASILTGAPLAGFSRHAVITKSPLTGAFLDSQAGGFWGPELKFSGFDAIVITGKSPKPVYLYIHNGEVEIKDASYLWGKVTGESQEEIREEIGEKKARMLLIGPGGENLVRYACILNECKHVNGRGGSGAVMGSKNLKAVVCRGTLKPEFADKEQVIEHGKWFSKNFMNNPANRSGHDYGSADYLSQQVEMEELPTHNFSEGNIKDGEKLSGTYMAETILTKRERCYACPVTCKRVVETGEPYNVDPYYGGPEYETLASFGSNLGITNIEFVAKAHELCNKFSLDTISTGGVIAFAIDCFKNGLLKKEDCDGLELEFGNEELVIKLIQKIANRDGEFGKLLGEGSKIAAERIGNGAEYYAVHTKGMEMALHDPRVKTGVGLGYACSALGGDHVVVEHDNDFDEYAPQVYLDQVKCLGLLRRINSQYIGPEKVRNFVYLQDHFSFMDSLSLCVLTFAPVRSFTMKHLIDIMDAITGWENSLWEVMKVGERRTNLAKVFNIREGFRRKDDKLPDKLFEPLKKQHMEDARINRQEFENAIDLYYEMMNWDEEGRPRKARLHELDISWAIEEIYQ
jgi:aldehyde:ferredoxin oxidoreductase